MNHHDCCWNKKPVCHRAHMRSSKSYFKRKRRMMRWTMNKQKVDDGLRSRLPRLHTAQNARSTHLKMKTTESLLHRMFCWRIMVQCILTMRIQLNILQIHCLKGAQYETFAYMPLDLSSLNFTQIFWSKHLFRPQPDEEMQRQTA